MLMKLPRFSHLVAGAFATALFASSFAGAQLSVEKVTATNKILQQMKATINKLPASHRQMLDGYANINHMADVWQTYGMRLTDPTFSARAKITRSASAFSPATGVVAVSNPSTDVAYSSFGGFTQSETSTARCGNSVVVGYNDSGSVFETPYFYSGSGGQSFSGASYSTNGGASFTDIGPINPGPNTFNFLGGDPGLNCADANTFYFSQIFDSYTDFDSSGTLCGVDSFGFAIPRTAIEFVVSHDGGVTWSATPKVAIQVCGNAGVQGSQLAVSSTGTLYISWVNLGSNFPLGPRSIQISSYANSKLSAPVTVESSIQPGGDSYYLQGEFRDFLDMSMAIDHSGTATDGALYFTWADGRDKTVPDPLAIQGFYAYDDVLLRASYDGGKTWGFATKVNSDIQSRLGSGHDHYQSGIAVDKRGY